MLNDLPRRSEESSRANRAGRGDRGRERVRTNERSVMRNMITRPEIICVITIALARRDARSSFVLKESCLTSDSSHFPLPSIHIPCYTSFRFTISHSFE